MVLLSTSGDGAKLGHIDKGLMKEYYSIGKNSKLA
jgi:hypothetical protein